jgi:hypothetical protein
MYILGLILTIILVLSLLEITRRYTKSHKVELIEGHVCDFFEKSWHAIYLVFIDFIYVFKVFFDFVDECFNFVFNMCIAILILLLPLSIAVIIGIVIFAIVKWAFIMTF